MKNFTYLSLIFLTSLFSTQVYAQDGYSYTLIHDDGYNFTVAAVPNYDSGTFTPITESYGFVIVLPDGITATFNEYLPTGTSGTPTALDGAAVSGLDPSMADKDLYLITTVTNAATFAAHTAGTVIPLVSLTVNGGPTSGEISILSNDSALVLAYSPLESFMQVDVVDDGTVVFGNGILAGTGLTGNTSFMFSTLTVEQVVLEDNTITIYPNPASDYITIISNLSSTYMLIDINGKEIFSGSVINGQSTIDLSKLNSGIYFIHFKNDSNITIKKIIKN
ncbi:T9SS type A sorting domain-containing protein [Xanthomarina spongicola]|uniref:Putative secreted protein (Por secretion system target) n=1 Tax=Xanthomarina spongicola TaxID=570520 RepID=A0A316E6K5_9FLAO|nr:T9SS type A sorting domain-containing protein [Xanthomarina spongicola]PWK18580.1 putative secreted protein (Por secretion system target) [Xanthomarina spongicola]